MSRTTAFSVGQHWRCIGREERGREPFDFVIVGPPSYGDPVRHKLCRLEVPGHVEKCRMTCPHGDEQTYSHAHLKKYAVHVAVPSEPR